MSAALLEPQQSSPSFSRQLLMEYDRLTKRSICKLLIDSGDRGVERTELFHQVGQIARSKFPQFDYDQNAFELDLISVQRKYSALYESVDRHVHIR